jgi:hypothetical protein
VVAADGQLARARHRGTSNEIHTSGGRPGWSGTGLRYRPALLGPGICGDPGRDAAPEVHGGHVGVLEGDFQPARMPGNQVLDGTPAAAGL